MKPNPNPAEGVTIVTPPVALTVDPGAAPALPVLEVLPPEEERELQECEREIDDVLHRIPLMARRLATVREKRLYRKHFRTFEDYCRHRWQFKAHRARQLCRGYAVLQNIGWDGEATTLEGLVLPLREGYQRVLGKLPPDQQKPAWLQAVSTAPARGMSMKHLKTVVTTFLGTKGQTVNLAPPPVLTITPPAPSNGTRVDLVIEQADMVCKEIQTLADLAGTADSVATGELTMALQIVQRLRNDAEQKRLNQKSRPAGPAGERPSTAGPFKAREARV